MSQPPSFDFLVPSSFAVYLCLCIGLVCWYVCYGLTCFLNGATLGWNHSQFLLPFYWLWKDLLWILPGGANRKAEYMRERIEGLERGCVSGDKKSWDYAEVNRTKDYRRCAADVLPNSTDFFMNHFVPVLFPFIFLVFAKFMILAIWNLIHALTQLF